MTESVVNYWVITEGLYTHTGTEKELRFNIENFPEFRDRIVYMPLRDMPFIEDAAKDRFDYWENEYYMRNAAMEAIRNIADENTIIVSDDLDEVLRPESILQYDPNEYLYASTQLLLSYYYFN
jgi:beta-1,4-mannosyl-glycoprotein beta-1,4-N-acetylglucosaminyltransferase